MEAILDYSMLAKPLLRAQYYDYYLYLNIEYDLTMTGTELTLANNTIKVKQC